MATTRNRGEKASTSYLQEQALHTSHMSRARDTEAGEPGSGRCDRHEWHRTEAVRGSQSCEPSGMDRPLGTSRQDVTTATRNREVIADDRIFKQHGHRNSQRGRDLAAFLYILTAIVLSTMTSTPNGRLLKPADTNHPDASALPEPATGMSEYAVFNRNWTVPRACQDKSKEGFGGSDHAINLTAEYQTTSSLNDSPANLVDPRLQTIGRPAAASYMMSVHAIRIGPETRDNGAPQQKVYIRLPGNSTWKRHTSQAAEKGAATPASRGSTSIAKLTTHIRGTGKEVPSNTSSNQLESTSKTRFGKKPPVRQHRQRPTEDPNRLQYSKTVADMLLTRGALLTRRIAAAQIALLPRFASLPRLPTTEGHDLQAFPNLSAPDISVLASPERSITRAEAGLERSVARAKAGVARESEGIGLTSRNASQCVWMFQGTQWELRADCSNTQGTELMFRTKRENRTIKSKVQAWETRYPVGPTDDKSASRLSGGDMELHVAQQPTDPQGGHNGKCRLKETDV